MSSSSIVDEGSNELLLHGDEASSPTVEQEHASSSIGRSNTVDDDDDDDDDELLTLHIKSFSNVNVCTTRNATVSQLKQSVRTALGPSSENRYLRLICRGRLLAPDSATLDAFGICNDDVLHAVLAAAGVRGGQQAALARASIPGSGTSGTGTSSSSSMRRYRGTGVGPLGRIVRPQDYAGTSSGMYSDDEDDDDDDNGEEGRERLGFDRLRASGLSRHEITAIRSYFSRQVDRYVQEHADDSNPVGQEETDLLRRRLLQEDAWMQSQGPTSEFRLNLNQSNPLLRFNATTAELMQQGSRAGSERDFLWGFLLGFFIGLIMLVWVWMPTVPHKQKLGILTGISLQLALTLLKSQEVEDLVEDGV